MFWFLFFVLVVLLPLSLYALGTTRNNQNLLKSRKAYILSIFGLSLLSLSFIFYIWPYLLWLTHGGFDIESVVSGFFARGLGILGFLSGVLLTFSYKNTTQIKYNLFKLIFVIVLFLMAAAASVIWWFWL